MLKEVAHTPMDEILEKDAKKILDSTLPSEADAAGAPIEDGKVDRKSVV